MSPHPAERGVAAIARTLAQDVACRWFLAAFVVTQLPFLLPVLSAETVAAYADVWVNLLLLPFVLSALLHRRGEIEAPAERQMWRYVTVAVLLWLAVWVLYAAIPYPRGTAVNLVIDGLYLLFYLCLLLAVETKPHLGKRDGSASPLETLDALSLAVLAFALLVYFILIPSRLDPETYASRVPSLYLYLAFDVLLAARFLQLAWTCRSTRWRHLYGLLGATAVLWAGFGALEIRWWVGATGWLDAAWLNVFWHLPAVTLVLAVRLRHHPYPEDDLSYSARGPLRRGLLRTGSPLILAALTLPAIHLGFSVLGLDEAATRTPREAVVLAGLLVLGGLALAERMLVQRESLRQNTYLTSLIESAPLPIVLLDPQHRVITCNPAFEALFLISRRQIVGRDIDGWIHSPETLEEAREITRRVLAGETTYTVTRRSRSDGSEVDVRLFGIPLTSGDRLLGVFAIYQDLTDRLRAEATLKQSEERFRRLAEAAFDGILLSVEGTIVDANEQAAEIFGYEVEQMIGTRLGRRVAGTHKKLVRQRTLSGYEQPYEVDCYRSDRSRITIEARGKSIPYKGRQARVTAIRDITEKRRLEEQLRFSQKMEAIGRLAAGIAHDFNNLLTIILARSELLGERLAAGTEARKWADEIGDAGECAASMTQQLLAFARQQPLRPEVLDLNQVVELSGERVKRLLREDIALVTDPAPDLGRVQADPGQIERVIMNLAINARDAMPDGGQLHIATANVQVDGSERASVDLEPGAYVYLGISDSGTGMEPEVLSRAFEPFFSTKDPGEGTGLGLATVHGIVRQSGGGITIDSAPGEGTTIHIYLPRVDEER